MKIKHASAILLLHLCLGSTAPAASPSRPAIAARPFALSDVKLLDGPFKRAMELDEKYLLELDPRRLLAGFRDVAGLPKVADRYAGWENAGVSGHILGHYLSACSMMFAATGDRALRQRIDFCVDELAECQKANGDGYLAGFTGGKKIFADIAAGHLDTTAGLNGGWVPWYTIHKDLAGLRDVYLYVGNDKAKAVLIAYADWVDNFAKHLNDTQFQKMLGVEQGGMNEVLADVYSITGDKKYLALSERFNHRAVLDPLMQAKDDLTGLHANTQVPKVIGLARQFELTNEATFRDGATFFWNNVTTARTFANGGNSNYEGFFPVGKMGSALSTSSSETCNTYNMLKLTGHLFSWDPQPRYVDYYERALYNHILASQDPDTGGMTYYVSLRSGTFKTFSSKFDSFWCCVGTGIENHAKYGGEIYAHNADALWVNLFVPSELTWADKGLTLKQETNFPDDSRSKLTITARTPTAATIKIRNPSWAGGGMKIAVNGQSVVDAGTGSHYVDISRLWATGDTITLELPTPLRAEPMPDDPAKVAVFAGPILLAGDMGTAGMPDSSVAQTDQLMFNRLAVPPVPVLVTDSKPVTEWVHPVDGSPLTYKTAGVGTPADLTLIPFFRANHVRYVVYFDTYTRQAWADKKARVLADAKARATLDAITIDTVHPGQQQSEHDHQFAGNQTNTGPFMDRQWRDATPHGYFSYDLKVDPDAPTAMTCTYWGSDGGREFELFANGHSLGVQKLTADHAGEFFDVTYPIPSDLTHGKQTINFKFAPHGGMVGGVFEVRVVKK